MSGRQPSADPMPSAWTGHDRFQGRLPLAWLFVGIWLVYLTDTLRDALTAPGTLRACVATAGVLAFGALYVKSWLDFRRLRRARRTASSRYRAVMLGSATLMAVVTAVLAGQSALNMAAFLVVMTMMLYRLSAALPLVLMLIAAVEASSRLVPGWAPRDQLGLQIAITALAMWGVLQVLQRNGELADAQAQIAGLAVEAERNRFGRDLHDILGHSLTVLAVKAELAGRLVQSDPARAAREIGDVEQLARQALTDVRAAVTGYRQMSLAGELAAARAALDAAGIEAQVPSAVDAVPGERRELLAWAVREGVTNVVRHSGARRCRISVDPEGVEIVDDGVGSGPGDPWPRAHGLAGLRERAAALGAVVLVGTATGGGFRLRVGW